MQQEKKFITRKYNVARLWDCDDPVPQSTASLVLREDGERKAVPQIFFAKFHQFVNVIVQLTLKCT